MEHVLATNDFPHSLLKKSFKVWHFCKIGYMRGGIKVDSRFIVFDLYSSDFSKVWQMKFRLWHVILTEIANMSPGQKNLESCQTNVLEQSLSSPLAFPILVNIKPYQKYTKITQNAVFNFFGAKFGVLPFLQECPIRCIQSRT